MILFALKSCRCCWGTAVCWRRFSRVGRIFGGCRGVVVAAAVGNGVIIAADVSLCVKTNAVSTSDVRVANWNWNRTRRDSFRRGRNLCTSDVRVAITLTFRRVVPFHFDFVPKHYSKVDSKEVSVVLSYRAEAMFRLSLLGEILVGGSSLELDGFPTTIVANCHFRGIAS